MTASEQYLREFHKALEELQRTRKQDQQRLREAKPKRAWRKPVRLHGGCLLYRLA